VVGFRLYIGNATRFYTNVIFVPGLSATNVLVQNLQPGTAYYFALTATHWTVTATTGYGRESDYSNEGFTQTAPALRPPTLRETTAVYAMSGRMLGQALLADDWQFPSLPGTPDVGEHYLLLRIDR